MTHKSLFKPVQQLEKKRIKIKRKKYKKRKYKNL